jgi:8-oxo-dGTP diphosphatase
MRSREPFVKQRIRVAGLVLDPDQRILLVRETDPVTGSEFWVPPGGGLEPQDSSVIACLQRELQEETGLTIQVGRLVYLREFAKTSRQVHHIELFFEVRDYHGHINSGGLANGRQADNLTRHAQWFRKDELASLQVYPEQLKKEFWLDCLVGVKHTQYLGVQVDNVIS